MAQKKQVELNKEITTLLTSSEDKLILNGLKKLKSKGTAELTPYVIDLIFEHNEGEIYRAAVNTINQLNDQKTLPFILTAIQSDASKGKRNILVSALWQSSLKCNDYVLEIIKIALKNDYATFVECLSVIENLSSPFNEDQIEQSIKLTSEALLHKKYEHEALLVEMNAVLKRLLIG